MTLLPQQILHSSGPVVCTATAGKTTMGALPKIILAVAVLAISACGTADKRAGSNGGESGGAVTSPVDLGDGIQAIPVDPNSIAGRAPKDRVIYFEFDTVDISSDYQSVITQHGRFLARNPDGRVRLEGHTDERGTREYNIALGEGRAKSIAQIMGLQGVAAGQMQTVSFGEELPTAEGSGEAAWSQNRRVVIVYEVE